MKNDFGKYLRSLRLAKKLGLRELARVVSANVEGRGITHAYLSIIESGRNPPPRIPILHGLAAALGVPPIEMEMAASGWEIILVQDLLQANSRRTPVPDIRKLDGLSPKQVLLTLSKAYDTSPLSLNIPKCIFLDTPRPFIAFHPSTQTQRETLKKVSGKQQKLASEPSH
ncbi:helix-turn-helix domain-containing protein [Nitrospira defluvii]|nr:helix-turn-helix transcriptional regulator [Nitrospira defluvii]